MNGVTGDSILPGLTGSELIRVSPGRKSGFHKWARMAGVTARNFSIAILQPDTRSPVPSGMAD